MLMSINPPHHQQASIDPTDEPKRGGWKTNKQTHRRGTCVLSGGIGVKIDRSDYDMPASVSSCTVTVTDSIVHSACQHDDDDDDDAPTCCGKAPPQVYTCAHSIPLYKPQEHLGNTAKALDDVKWHAGTPSWLSTRNILSNNNKPPNNNKQHTAVATHARTHTHSLSCALCTLMLDDDLTLSSLAVVRHHRELLNLPW